MTESEETGAQVIAMLGGKDLNKDGIIVNLVICGNSRFYDYSWLEDELCWYVEFVYPDMIITAQRIISQKDGLTTKIYLGSIYRSMV